MIERTNAIENAIWKDMRETDRQKKKVKMKDKMSMGCYLFKSRNVNAVCDRTQSET